MPSAFDVVILGGGCAGYTAAIYTGRAMLRTLLLAGPLPGGQLTLTSLVENFPGFPEGILGPTLMERMRAQAERFGAQVVDESADRVDLHQNPFRIWAGGLEYQAKALIVATGATPRRLGVPGEEVLMGRGVSTCATCDGAFFKGQEVAVVGGGDSAMEEALYLAHLGCTVNVVHRRDQLRASRVMQARAFNEPRIRFIWNSVVEEILGSQRVEGIVIRSLVTGERRTLKVAALFVAIGHEPNTYLFRGQLELDERGYIVTRGDTTQTSREGVFAAGEVRDWRYRQAITAAGDGCRAAMDAERWLRDKGLI